MSRGFFSKLAHNVPGLGERGFVWLALRVSQSHDRLARVMGGAFY